MVRYISEKQLSIEEFKIPFQAKLSAENRWVKLSQVVPWDEFASVYMTYHEAGDLIPQEEAYRDLHGHYPELVQVDKIYATHENRRWLKERGIRITAPPLGRRPTKTKLSYYQKRKTRKEATERNYIEGKFGQAKNAYNLDEIRA